MTLQFKKKFTSLKEIEEYISKLKEEVENIHKEQNKQIRYISLAKENFKINSNKCHAIEINYNGVKTTFQCNSSKISKPVLDRNPGWCHLLCDRHNRNNESSKMYGKTYSMILMNSNRCKAYHMIDYQCQNKSKKKFLGFCESHFEKNKKINVPIVRDTLHSIKTNTIISLNFSRSKKRLIELNSYISKLDSLYFKVLYKKTNKSYSKLQSFKHNK